jgi:hypothetical protein
MNKLRQEFCDETNTPIGLDNEFDYIRWLEAQIKALRIHDVSGQVCVHCGKGRDMHTVASAMCLDRMKHFEQTLR